MAVDFIAGCLGGCAGLMVGYPLDTIKVRIQTQNSKNPQFRGTWHCFRSMLAKESVGSFYRGMSSPIAGVAAVNAIVFGVYGQAQRYLTNSDDLSTHFIAGSLAGLAQSPVVSPLELVKTRLQIAANNAPQLGPMQCFREIYRRFGVVGIFSGFGITVLREVPSYGLYFFTYEALTRMSTSPTPSTLYMLIAGGLAGTASWVFTYPIDVIKSRLQADSTAQYRGAVDCLRKSLRDDGVKCLMRGLNSTIIRAFPTNAATFVVVHWTFRICGQHHDTHNKCPTKNQQLLIT